MNFSFKQFLLENITQDFYSFKECIKNSVIDTFVLNFSNNSKYKDIINDLLNLKSKTLEGLIDCFDYYRNSKIRVISYLYKLCLESVSIMYSAFNIIEVKSFDKLIQECNKSFIKSKLNLDECLKIIFLSQKQRECLIKVLRMIDFSSFKYPYIINSVRSLLDSLENKKSYILKQGFLNEITNLDSRMNSNLLTSTIAKCSTQQAQVDYRPNEALPEDYYAADL